MPHETIESHAQAAPLDASIELSPKQIDKDAGSLLSIPSGTRVYILDTGVTATAQWAEAARTVIRAGLTPVPHLAARRIASRQQLADRLGALAGEIGVSDVLVIGGGAKIRAGPFASSMDLLETGLIERSGIRRIGIAGHPDGSPEISPAAIDTALRWKIAWAERTGIELRIVTQFGFDVAATLAWSTKLVGSGCSLPVHLGVAGPTGLASLLRYAAMCGVKTSMAVATRRGAALSALVTSYTPEPIALAVERHAVALPASTVVQLHVFPFGGLAATAHWLTTRGSWQAQTESEGMAS